MNISFDNLPIGPYTEEMLKKQWNGAPKSRGVSEGRCNIVNIDEENVLEVTLLKDNFGPQDGGASWKYKFDETFDELTVEYKFRVSEDFNPARGGKLPGLGGGSHPTGGASTKEADGFSARVMWRELGVLEQYVYSMDRSLEKNWGEDYLWSTTENKNQIITPTMWEGLKEKVDGRVYLKPNTWHTAKTYVKMNTPGEKYGKITTWFDGKEVLNLDLQFRKDKSFGIDSFNFSCFFGGNDKTWAPKKDEKIYFKDFVFTK